MRTNLAEWTRIVNKHEKSFLRAFCHSGWELIGVWWSAESMRVEYFINDYQRVCDTAPINEFISWYKRKKKPCKPTNMD